MYTKVLIAQWEKDIDQRNQAISEVRKMQRTVQIMRDSKVTEVNIKKVVDDGVAATRKIMPSTPIAWKGEDEPIEPTEPEVE